MSENNKSANLEHNGHRNKNWEELFLELENHEGLNKMLSSNPLSNSLNELMFPMICMLQGVVETFKSDSKIKENLLYIKENLEKFNLFDDSEKINWKVYLTTFENIIKQYDLEIDNSTFAINSTRFRIKLILNAYCNELCNKIPDNATEQYLEFVKNGLKELKEARKSDFSFLNKWLNPFKIDLKLLLKFDWNLYNNTLFIHEKSQDAIKIADKIKKIYSIRDEARKLDTIESNSTKTPSHQQQRKKKLSVSDWSIIFYYVDEAGTKEGNKIDRIEKFIEKNNILRPSGTLTTKGFFKKEYHEIENRINGKKDKNPLPPERIKNILHFLKKNKKALEAAKSDIEHLTDEIEENERNTY